MAIKDPTERRSPFLDKLTLQQYVRELDDRSGFSFDPTATAEGAQELARREGIRPEDNILSSELLRQRYGDLAE